MFDRQVLEKEINFGIEKNENFTFVLTHIHLRNIQVNVTADVTCVSC